MMTIPVKLTFMTPAFIGGTNNSREAEFRLASLKGVLRYWWRQFQDQSHSRALFEKESRIFGSTQGQSRVHMWQTSQGPQCSPGGAAFNEARDGIKYLLYSCYALSRNQPGRLQWILSGQSVQIEMKLAGLPADNQEVLLALYLAQTFGGLGYRARRGAGSFQLSVSDNPTSEQDFQNLLNVRAKEFIETYRRQTGALLPWVQLVHKDSPAARSFGKPDHFREVAGNPGQTWADILDLVGRALKHHRTIWEYDPSKTDPYQIEARALHAAGGAVTGACGKPYAGPDPLTKAAFGLPIQYRFKQRDPVTKAVIMRTGRSGRPGPTPEPWSVEAAPATHERRASPLFINVKQDTGGMPYANLLILWNKFLPSGELVALEKVEEIRGQKIRTALGTVNQPTDAALVSFLKRFP